MKTSAFAFLVIVLALARGLVASTPAIPDGYEVRESDFVFQSLPHAPLVDAIEGVTRSPYSHCGIVARKGDAWIVIEAIGPVRETPLGEWIARGRDARFDAYRLSPALTPRVPAILEAARTYFGRPYDIHYRFDDERIYCSELIFKAVKTATGQALGKVEKLGELNWKPHEAFIRSIEGSVPMDRAMITPDALSQAPELNRVFGSLR